MEQALAVIPATEDDVATIVEFQIIMAKQTENLDLSPKIINQGVTYLFQHPDQGFYIVARLNKVVIGCILGTIQNPDKAWIQSVYVDGGHRKKGVFKKMFQQLCSVFRVGKFKSVYLYAEEDNQRALMAYEKMGMTKMKDVDALGFSFVYSNDSLPAFNQPITSLKVDSQAKHQFGHLRDILKVDRDGNTPLYVLQNQKVVGYAEYFGEFSDWRSGRIIYVTKLYLGDNPQTILTFLLYHLKSLPGPLIASIRFMAHKSSDLRKIIQIPRLHYTFMEMGL